MLVPDGRDDIRGDVDSEIARVAPVDRAREAPIPTTSIDDRLDAVLLHEVFDVDAIFPRDLQGRSRAAGSLACDVLAPRSLRIDAIEGVGQQLLVDRIDREVAEHQRRGQAGGNVNAFLHEVGPRALVTQHAWRQCYAMMPTWPATPPTHVERSESAFTPSRANCSMIVHS